jgi:hypothetical protein
VLQTFRATDRFPPAKSGASLAALGREEPIALTGRSRSLLVEAIAVEWLQLEVQRSVTSQDVGWLVPAAVVIGLQSLTGCSQSGAVAHPVTVNVSRCPGV